MARLEIVGGMGHFVEERVDTLGTVALEHQIDVQGDLGHVADTVLSLPRSHVAQGGRHPSTQPKGDVPGEAVAEAGGVEVVEERVQVAALCFGATAMAFLVTVSSPTGVSGPRLPHRLPQWRPLAKSPGRSPGSLRGDPPFTNEQREGIEQGVGRAAVGGVHVQRPTATRQRPEGSPILPDSNAPEARRPPTAQFLQEVFGSPHEKQRRTTRIEHGRRPSSDACPGMAEGRGDGRPGPLHDPRSSPFLT